MRILTFIWLCDTWLSCVLDKYNLGDIQGLHGLYEKNIIGFHVLLKLLFRAGILIAQCSESMNAFFDGYVNSKTTLKQFMEKYEKTMESEI